MKFKILEKFIPRVTITFLFTVILSQIVGLIVNYSSISKINIISSIFLCFISIFFINTLLNRNKPKTKIKLKHLIRKNVIHYGENCDLNHIDVSRITDMSNLFFNIKFNGDIGKWNVSNVKNMSSMFMESPFNGNISNWNVSNVENMKFMFSKAKFNGDISKWDVSKVKIIGFMFHESEFAGNITNWDVSNAEDIYGIFFKSKFKDTISDEGLEPPYWYFYEEQLERSSAVTKHLLHKDLVLNMKNENKPTKKIKI